jgi:ketosteroid isomerase-like protein
VKTSRILLSALIFCLPSLVVTQEKAPGNDEAAHNALRALRDNMLAAFNKQDIDEMLKYVHQDVVFTSMDGRVSRGHDAIRAYFNQMMKGPDRIMENIKVYLNVDALTILYGGDTGIAYGSSGDHYKLTDG